MNIYVGNFSYDVTGEELQDIFGAFGRVTSAKIIIDKLTGESKGFGFVDMPDKKEAQAALDGITEIKGRRITVNEARPQVRHGFGGDKRGGPRGKSFRGAKRY